MEINFSFATTLNWAATYRLVVYNFWLDSVCPGMDDKTTVIHSIEYLLLDDSNGNAFCGELLLIS